MTTRNENLYFCIRGERVNVCRMVFIGVILPMVLISYIELHTRSTSDQQVGPESGADFPGRS